MSYTFTPLATDNFHRPNGPLSRNWTDDGQGDPVCTVLSNVCVGSLPTLYGISVYKGLSFPGDQYAAITVGAFGLTSVEEVYIRCSANLTVYYNCTLQGDGSGAAVITLYSSSGVLGTNTVPAANPGDILLLGAIGTTIFVQYNGVTQISVTDSSATFGLPGLEVVNIAVQTDTTISLFAAGIASALPLPYSVPDCRNYATFPNSARDIQGTLTYDVQTSSNPSVPSTDCRTAGAPVDCRVSPNIPLNSRTPGIFGPNN